MEPYIGLKGLRKNLGTEVRLFMTEPRISPKGVLKMEDGKFCVYDNEDGSGPYFLENGARLGVPMKKTSGYLYYDVKI